jgi:HTH-type transcriptional regulator, competence development regulator
MPQTALGVTLQFLREQRGLSLRELARLSETDHAYIYRLEAGDKESPSGEVLTKLARALKVDKREADILKFAAEHGSTDVGLVTHVLTDKGVSYEIFASAAGAVFRGTVRPDYAKLIERVRKILDEEEGGDG